MGLIPENLNDLLQKKAFAQLATLMPDGSPHVSPVWFVEYDGRNVVINSAKGRVKDRNMRRDPRVGLDIQDPDNPYRHLSIRGRVVEITETGADEHIDKLSKKYLNQDRRGLPPRRRRQVPRSRHVNFTNRTQGGSPQRQWSK